MAAAKPLSRKLVSQPIHCLTLAHTPIHSSLIWTKELWCITSGSYTANCGNVGGGASHPALAAAAPCIADGNYGKGTRVVAMHICDRADCLNVHHLFWGTKSENKLGKRGFGMGGVRSYKVKADFRLDLEQRRSQFWLTPGGFVL